MNRLAVGLLARAQQAKKVKLCYNSSNVLKTFHFDSVIHIQTKPNTYDHVHKSGNRP